jgi:DNA polymerase-4
MKIFEEVTPLIEPLSLDEAFLDVTGAKRLLGEARKIADLIRSRVETEQGITCSVGIAHNKFIAKIASSYCKPNGVLEISPDKVLEFLHPLEVNQIWGVGPKTNEQLAKLGLIKIADIAHTPRQTLIRALGEASGSSLYELAWGRDYRDVETERIEKSVSSSETFDQDLDNQEEILKHLLSLTEKSAERMRAKGFACYTVGIKVRYTDFRTITRSKTLELPTTTSQEIFEIVRQLYLALNLAGQTIRLVGVSLDSLVENEGIQQMVLGQRPSGWRQVDRVADKIRDKFGRSSLRPARLVEDHEELGPN